MSQPSRHDENMAKLEQIKLRNKTATHVYVKRWGMDDLTIDIPIGHVEGTLKIHPNWEIVSSNNEMDDTVAALFKEPLHDEPTQQATEETDIAPLEIPPKPSESKPTKPVRKPRAKRNA